MGIVGWDTKSKDGNGNGNVEYLYLNGGKSYTIRPLKSPIEYAQYFYKHPNEKKMRFAFIPLSNIEKCPVKAKYPTELPKNAQKRYSVLVIDRNDPDKIKVMPFPWTVYDQMCSLAQHQGVEPGEKNGCDFTIKVTGSGQFDTRYQVMFDACNDLTSDELKLYQKYKDSVDLQKIYKPGTPEEVEKRLFGKFDFKSSETSEKSVSNEEQSKPEEDEIPF